MMSTRALTPRHPTHRLVQGKEWKPRSCHTYLHVDTPAQEAATYIKMAAEVRAHSSFGLSVLLKLKYN